MSLIHVSVDTIYTLIELLEDIEKQYVVYRVDDLEEVINRLKNLLEEYP